MPRLLRRLDVREISLVGRPANRRRFAIVKMDTTDREGTIAMTVHEDVKERIGEIRAAMNSGEFGEADELLDKFERFLLEEVVAEEGEEKAARRKPEDEEPEGYARPKRPAPGSAVAKINQMAEALVQKDTGGLTMERAWARVVKANPDLYADYRREREREAAARR